jgi:hypothetical protein
MLNRGNVTYHFLPGIVDDTGWEQDSRQDVPRGAVPVRHQGRAVYRHWSSFSKERLHHLCRAPSKTRRQLYKTPRVVRCAALAATVGGECRNLRGLACVRLWFIRPCRTKRARTWWRATRLSLAVFGPQPFGKPVALRLLSGRAVHWSWRRYHHARWWCRWRRHAFPGGSR